MLEYILSHRLERKCQQLQGLAVPVVELVVLAHVKYILSLRLERQCQQLQGLAVPVVELAILAHA